MSILVLEKLFASFISWFVVLRVFRNLNWTHFFNIIILFFAFWNNLEYNLAVFDSSINWDLLSFLSSSSKATASWRWLWWWPNRAASCWVFRWAAEIWCTWWVIELHALCFLAHISFRIYFKFGNFVSDVYVFGFLVILIFANVFIDWLDADFGVCFGGTLVFTEFHILFDLCCVGVWVGLRFVLLN